MPALELAECALAPVTKEEKSRPLLGEELAFFHSFIH